MPIRTQQSSHGNRQHTLGRSRLCPKQQTAALMLPICLPETRLSPSSHLQEGMAGQAMARADTPSLSLPWSPPISPKNKASQCSAAPDRGKGSERSLDFCKSDICPVAYTAPFLPLCSQAQELQHWRDLPLRQVCGIGPM